MVQVLKLYYHCRVLGVQKSVVRKGFKRLAICPIRSESSKSWHRPSGKNTRQRYLLYHMVAECVDRIATGKGTYGTFEGSRDKGDAKVPPEVRGVKSLYQSGRGGSPPSSPSSLGLSFGKFR